MICEYLNLDQIDECIRRENAVMSGYTKPMQYLYSEISLEPTCQIHCFVEMPNK